MKLGTSSCLFIRPLQADAGGSGGDRHPRQRPGRVCSSKKKAGRLIACPGIEMSDRVRCRWPVRNIARVLGDRRWSGSARGSNAAPCRTGRGFAAVLAPCSLNGTILAIRKFSEPAVIRSMN